MSEHIATQAEIEDMIKGRIIHELVAELDNRFYLAYQGDN